MSGFVWGLFMSIIFVFTPMLVVIGLLKLNRWRDNSERRSPLTSSLLRGPGESLREEIKEISSKIDDQLTYILVYPILGAAFTFLSLNYLQRKDFLPLFIILLLFFSFVIVISITKLLKLDEKRSTYRIGLEGEIAAGQELNLLMRDGAWVFHDVPAPKFNIDHVIVSQAGVFAVETKAKRKLIKNKDRDKGEVVYDGKTLKFPDAEHSCFLEQAESQARWLSKELGGAIGERVLAQPVLVLPGWFVEKHYNSPPEVMVINPMYNDFLRELFLKPDVPPKLSKEQIERVRYQLDKWCRIE